jgi:hypothetical protein
LRKSKCLNKGRGRRLERTGESNGRDRKDGNSAGFPAQRMAVRGRKKEEKNWSGLLSIETSVKHEKKLKTLHCANPLQGAVRTVTTIPTGFTPSKFNTILISWLEHVKEAEASVLLRVSDRFESFYPSQVCHRFQKAHRNHTTELLHDCIGTTTLCSIYLLAATYIKIAFSNSHGKISIG